MDLVRPPLGCLEPNNTSAMSSAGDEVGLAIAADVRNQDVRRPWLFGCDQVLRPGLGRVSGGLPPGEPIASAGLGGRPALGGAGRIDSAVPIDVSQAKIVAEPRSIMVREDVPQPGLSW